MFKDMNLTDTAQVGGQYHRARQYSSKYDDLVTGWTDQG